MSVAAPALTWKVNTPSAPEAPVEFVAVIVYAVPDPPKVPKTQLFPVFVIPPEVKPVTEALKVMVNVVAVVAVYVPLLVRALFVMVTVGPTVFRSTVIPVDAVDVTVPLVCVTVTV